LAASVELDWSVLVDPTDAQLEAIYRDGASKALATLGVDDRDITSQVFKEAAEYASMRSAEMVGMKYDEEGNLVENPDSIFAISDTTRDDIKAAVADAIENGTPAADLADTISDMGAFSDARAMMIARTELIAANNKGHMSAFRNSGVVQYKAWSTAGDDDVDEEICQANEDEGPIPLDDDFGSGDSEPPGHPNCRCTLVAVVGADAAEADEDDDEEEE
jgi:SPP1 gp7 family putative phage head morphogenesis protein